MRPFTPILYEKTKKYFNFSNLNPMARKRSHSHSGVITPPSSPQQLNDLDRQVVDTAFHAPDVYVGLAFAAMFFSLYNVLTLNPASTATVLGAGAISLAILSACNMVRSRL